MEKPKFVLITSDGPTRDKLKEVSEKNKFASMIEFVRYSIRAFNDGRMDGVDFSKPDTDNVCIRSDIDTKDDLKKIAKTVGLPMSEFIRRVVHSYDNGEWK